MLNALSLYLCILSQRAFRSFISGSIISVGATFSHGVVFIPPIAVCCGISIRASILSLAVPCTASSLYGD